MSNPDLPPPPTGYPASLRAAWILVIIMTALLALALIAVVWGFIRQGRILMERRAPAAASAMTLPAGAKIVSSSTEGGRLVLQLQTREGEEIRIIDIGTGKLVQTIKTGP